ncbi:ubiquitin/ribosomal protein S30e fusion protein [Anopheles sinensis]|uniref:40S ribosomal protein S30 n=1 Tax=Anopheles sinensis TaxID=74873 RepID=A0A084WNC2_ANOSI|nr:ubiquitin/ribosomal protein S30e fusion protein [Anopheles sinensis]
MESQFNIQKGVVRIVLAQPTDTIKDVIAQMEQMENLVPGQALKMYYEGRPVSEEVLVSSLQSNELELLVPLPGGKVHGSLARAGKVRGQTPKVEKQERKKRAKTGRAKRRAQFNRRCKCVVRRRG